MAQPTAEGNIWALDTRLRPEGENGPLVCSLQTYQSYYDNRAQLWEMQALTRARAISGPLKDEFMELAKAAWRRASQDPELLVKIDSMLERIRRERGSGSDFLDLKTGCGGIIEAEFLVQALQMRENIWEPNWDRAVSGLCGRGLFNDAEAKQLRQSYQLLRRCESGLRRYENKAVSSLPTDQGEQQKLAIRLGYDSFENFRRDYVDARDTVHALYERKIKAFRLARNVLEHLSVRREFLHEHQETLNRFLGFVSGQTAPDEIDFLQLPRLQQQFFAACSGQKDVDGRINPLVADFSVEHHFHVSGAFELLKDQLIHPAAGFNQRRGDDGERTRFLGVPGGCENLSWRFHGTRVDTTAHGAAATAHCIIKSTSGARDGIEEDEHMFSSFDQSFGSLDRQLRNPRVTFYVRVVGAGHQLRCRMRPTKISHFFGTFIDQKNNELHLRMILGDRFRDVMQQRCLACARRRDNQTALAHSQRRHQIHDPRGVTIR